MKEKPHDKCLRRDALRSRYGNHWPLDIFKRPDGAYYATLSLSSALCARHGEGEGGGISFIDPDGGPFIGEGFVLIVSYDPLLVSEVESVEAPTKEGGRYLLHLNTPHPYKP